MQGGLFETAEPAPDCFVVTVHDDLDLFCADDLQQHLDGLLRSGGLLVLDVGPLHFADSSGLRVLIMARRIAAERGARLCLAAVRPWLRELLAHTGMHDLFDFGRDADEAIAKIALQP